MLTAQLGQCGADPTGGLHQTRSRRMVVLLAAASNAMA